MRFMREQLEAYKEIFQKHLMVSESIFDIDELSAVLTATDSQVLKSISATTKLVAMAKGAGTLGEAMAQWISCLQQDAARAHELWPHLIPRPHEGKQDKKLLQKYVSDVLEVIDREIAKRQKIFIGHGRSKAWRELKTYIEDSLHLEWDEFNREPTAGYQTSERLSIMLEHATLALIVMTAEDEYKGNVMRARSNVIHEVGLFQARLGFHRAIILLEEGCDRFSNVDGITYIGFPPGNIQATFEEISRVLIREGLKAKTTA
jgi:hypothetical protein